MCYQHMINDKKFKEKVFPCYCPLFPKRCTAAAEDFATTSLFRQRPAAFFCKYPFQKLYFQFLVQHGSRVKISLNNDIIHFFYGDAA